MSGPGDYPDEMDRLRKIDDDGIESLLAGRAPADEPGLGELAKLIDGVKLATVQPMNAVVEERHLAAMLDAASTAPEGKTHRRRAPLWTKVAAAAVAVVGATGGLAAADQLPQPAQDAISSVAERVGVNFPHSQDDVAVTEEEPTEGDTTDNETTESKRVNEDVQTVLEDDSLEGRDKGAAVSDAADQNRQDGNTPAAEHRQNSGDHPSGPPEDAPSQKPNDYGPDNHPTGPPSEHP